MSFILDGLNRLEENRQRDSVPDLLTVHAPGPQNAGKRSVLYYLLLAALLLNALLIAVWIHPWISEKKNIVKQAYISSGRKAVNIKQADPEAGAVNEVSLQKTDVIKQEHIIIPEKETLKEHTTTEVIITESEDNKQPADIKEASLISPLSAEQKDPVDHNLLAEPSDEVLELSELPLSIRQDLPEISISAHIYSNNPSSRIVNINGYIAREGGKITPELEVDEITVTGVILKYRGYRFRMRGL